MSSFRCPGCKGRFRVEDAHRKIGLNYVCSSACARAMNTWAREPQPRTQPRTQPTRKPKPKPKPTKSDIPPRTRAELHLRDKGCRFCGRRDAEAHHICYKSEGIDHQLHNLVLLCDEHHALVHSNKKYWKPILLAYVWVRMVEGRAMTIPAIERRLEKRAR